MSTRNNFLAVLLLTISHGTKAEFSVFCYAAEEDLPMFAQMRVSGSELTAFSDFLFLYIFNSPIYIEADAISGQLAFLIDPLFGDVREPRIPFQDSYVATGWYSVDAGADLSRTYIDGQTITISAPNCEDSFFKPQYCSAFTTYATVLGGNDFTVKTLCPHTMTRTIVTESGMEVVQPDWSVFGPSGELLGTSSAAHLESMRSCSLDGEPGQPFSLVISAYEHPRNENFMTTPIVDFKDGLSQAFNRQGLDSGLFAFLIEISESGRPAAADLIASTGALPEGLANAVLRNIRIRYTDSSRHRFSYFVLMEYRHGVARIVDSVIVLPKCCSPNDPQ